MSAVEPRRAVNGDEVDAHSRWRHVLHWRPGERAKIKRLTNRRERHERKVDAQRRVVEEATPCVCDDRTCPECW